MTVSTPELERVFRCVSGKPVAIIPNRIDTTEWTVGPRRSDDDYVIGYAGSPFHTPDLEMVAPALWNVLRRRPEARLRVLGCRPIAVPPRLAHRVSWGPWQPIASARQAVEALRCDVGIAPLVDTPFNRGRSNLKWLQFGALGIPIVAAALAPYDCIQDGYDGYLAADLEEWETRLVALAKYPSIRRNMGDAARFRVAHGYDLSLDREARERAYGKVLPPAPAQAAANPTEGDAETPEPCGSLPGCRANPRRRVLRTPNARNPQNLQRGPDSARRR